VSAVLGLTAAMLAVSTAVTAPFVLSQSRSDAAAAHNLRAVLTVAKDLRRQHGDFAQAVPEVLKSRVFDIAVVDAATTSSSDAVISMAVADDGWYGAVHSRTGRCLAVGNVAGAPTDQQVLLPGNCTGDAARATLAPLKPSATAPSPPPSGSAAGSPRDLSGSGSP